MRIGIDIRNIGKKRTGDETVFFNLAKNLTMIDRKNTYLLFTDIESKEILEEIATNLEITSLPNVEIISLKSSGRFNWNFWVLPKYLRKNPVDIYLTQYITPWFLPKKIKIVTIIHDISFNFYPKLIKKSDLFFLKTLIPISLRMADKVIGVSRFTRDEIWKYYKIPLEKLDFIHNAISEDFAREKITQEKISYVKKRYEINGEYILYIGTHQPRKNIPVLVSAYSILVDPKKPLLENPRPILVLAGGRSYNTDPEIEKRVKDLDLKGKVVFPGFISENHKAALVAGARAFVFPSLYEGFGIPILEAMSVGTPVIASDIYPHREISAEAALFFNPKSPDDLAEKLKLILTGHKKHCELSKAGKERVKNFSWKNSAEKLLSIFEKMSGSSD